jgi:hypothetical protein
MTSKNHYLQYRSGIKYKSIRNLTHRPHVKINTHVIITATYSPNKCGEF